MSVALDLLALSCQSRLPTAFWSSRPATSSPVPFAHVQGNAVLSSAVFKFFCRKKVVTAVADVPLLSTQV